MGATRFLFLPLTAGLAACTMPFGESGDAPAPEVFAGEVQTPGADTLRPLGRPGSEPVADAPREVPSGALGVTVLSLGDPSDAGLWVETPLVSAETPGRVERADGGGAADVTLRPGPEGGARGSLQTLLALGLSPAALADVTLSRR